MSSRDEARVRVVKGGWSLIRPSQHLTWDELACHDAVRSPYPLDWRTTRLPLLVAEFEAVREMLSRRLGLDVPLVVHSAYRTRSYNALINGAPSSQHVEGRALDIAPAPSTAVRLRELHAVVMQRATEAGVIRGVGQYDTFVHLDIRPTSALAVWDLRSRR